MEHQVTEEELKNMSPEQIAELQKQNCIFCKIISGEIPSKKVFEDEFCTAILDINPANEGHVLILPKEHYQILPQIPENIVGKLFVVAKEISHSILQAFGAKGTNIFVANGQVAGQRAPHFMIHVFQRAEGDGIFKNNPSKLSAQDIQKLKSHLVPKISRLFGSGAEEESASLLETESIDQDMVRDLQRKKQQDEEQEEDSYKDDFEEYDKAEETEKRSDAEGEKPESKEDENKDKSPEEDNENEDEHEGEEHQDVDIESGEKFDLDKIGDLFR